MRLSTMIMIAVAVVFGLLAVFVAQAWLNSQAEMRARNLDAQKKPLATQTIVVAAKPLRFGAELSGMSLREIPWTQDAVPPGAFSKISDLTSTRRVVLTAIEANEPILSSKITGSGQRVTLSAVLADGMKAVTIRDRGAEAGARSHGRHAITRVAQGGRGHRAQYPSHHAERFAEEQHNG